MFKSALKATTLEDRKRSTVRVMRWRCTVRLRPIRQSLVIPSAEIELAGCFSRRFIVRGYQGLVEGVMGRVVAVTGLYDGGSGSDR